MRMEHYVSTFSATGQPPKATCRQCRFRKVKCDGRRGNVGCGDCERLRFDCSLAAGPTTPTALQTAHAAASISSSLSSPTVETGRVVERRRTSKACTHCRVQKIRCTGGAPCQSCKKKGVSCAYGTDRRRGSRVTSVAGPPVEAELADNVSEETHAADYVDTSTTSPTTPGTTNSEPVTVAQPSLRRCFYRPEVQQLLEFYFDHVYSLPSYAFLHPQTTIRQCREGTLDPCLSYAISAVASHHMGPSRGRGDVGQSWTRAAEDLIWRHIEAPTLPRLQALLLIVLYRVETGSNKRAFMLSSIAARAAAAMRLNYERTTPPDGTSRIASEVRRRVMWSLKLVERYFCMGLPEFELCPGEAVYLDLPCSEQDFSAEAAQTGSRTSEQNPQTSDYGSYQLCVKLEMLRRDVVKLTRSLSVCDAPLPGLPSLLHGFEQHLSQIRHELPNGARLEPARIAQLLDTPWLARQLLVHLSFHQAYSDLYRILLRGYREAAPAVVLDALDQSWLDKAEQLSLQHSTAIVDILATLNQQSQRAQLLEFDTAICGYHATRVLLFIAQFGRSGVCAGEEWALSRAELCMASLKRFFPTSKLVKPILQEMKRMITLFAARSDTTTPSRLASPGPSTNQARDSSMGLSAAARVRQRLAIHSLLRQADFTDEDESSERRGSSDHNQWLVSPSMPPCPTQATAEIDALSQLASAHSVPSPGTSSGGNIWEPRWLSNDGGFMDQWDPELPPAPPTTNGPRTPSLGLTFPWIQRWGGFPNTSDESM